MDGIPSKRLPLFEGWRERQRRWHVSRSRSNASKPSSRAPLLNVQIPSFREGEMALHTPTRQLRMSLSPSMLPVHSIGTPQTPLAAVTRSRITSPFRLGRPRPTPPLRTTAVIAPLHSPPQYQPSPTRIKGILRRIAWWSKTNHDLTHKSPQRLNIELLISLSALIVTAALCTFRPYLLIADVILAFALRNFPYALHLVFIAMLFTEFTFMAQSLLKRNLQSRRRRSIEDAPQFGAIVQGAQNWSGGQDQISVSPGNPGGLRMVEAVTPMPPAYGIYRGTVRIGDSDIR
jgi:hypothetical protein